jgi:hypothetical protein
MIHKEVDLDYVKSNYNGFEDSETILKSLLKNDLELQLVESRIADSIRINLVRKGKFLATISK